jgi:hypothetical protein
MPGKFKSFRERTYYDGEIHHEAYSTSKKLTISRHTITPIPMRRSRRKYGQTSIGRKSVPSFGWWITEVFSLGTIS